MPRSQVQPGRTSQFWALAFWLVVVHAAGLSFICIGLYSLSDIITPAPSAYPWRTIGLINATAFWLAEHARYLLELTFLTDMAALFITWRSAHLRRAPSVLIAGYLIAGLGAALLVLAANYILVLAKEVQIGTTTYIYTLPHREDSVVLPLVLTVPAWVILFGILFKTPPPSGGFCSKCGYDLRASKDRCPECGTVIPVAADESV